MATRDMPAYPYPWTISDWEDRWNIPSAFETREAAIAAAPDILELEPGDPFWTGYMVPAGAPMPIAEQILEDMFEEASDSSDHAEDWLEDVPPAARAELQKGLDDLIHAWLVKHDLLPDWCDIERIEQHRAPGGEIAASGAPS